jgi:hypothetical protein
MIPVNAPLLDCNKKAYLVKAIEDGWIYLMNSLKLGMGFLKIIL